MSDKDTKQPDQSRESLEHAGMQDDQMQDIHAQLLREKEEPTEGFNPIPIFLLFVFGALSFWAGFYLVKYSGDFRWDAYDPNFVAGAEKAPPPEISLIERGAKVYRAQCAQCHQDEGQGVGGVYPPLAGADWVTGHSEVLARILINGLNGPIEVAGNTYNGNMPAFGPDGLNLRPVEIAGVLTYIRQEWGNDAPEITEEMMDTYLDAYSGRSTPWQATELREDLGDDLALSEGGAEADSAEEADEAEDESTESEGGEDTESETAAAAGKADFNGDRG
ncbi:MAG: c-type cytochrome [Opitutales bacterium]